MLNESSHTTVKHSAKEDALLVDKAAAPKGPSLSPAETPAAKADSPLLSTRVPDDDERPYHALSHRDPDISPNASRRDSEAMIGDSSTVVPGAPSKSTERPASLPASLTRWASQDADPFEWADVRAMVFCYFALMLAYAVLYGLANHSIWPFQSITYWILTGFTILIAFRMVWRIFTKLNVAEGLRLRLRCSGGQGAAAMPSGRQQSSRDDEINRTQRERKR